MSHKLAAARLVELYRQAMPESVVSRLGAGLQAHFESVIALHQYAASKLELFGAPEFVSRDGPARRRELHASVSEIHRLAAAALSHRPNGAGAAPQPEPVAGAPPTDIIAAFHKAFVGLLTNLEHFNVAAERLAERAMGAEVFGEVAGLSAPLLPRLEAIAEYSALVLSLYADLPDADSANSSSADS